jgi:uncharacterized membrane protein
MIVHFPIVLILLVAAFEIGATVLGKDVSGRTATGTLAVSAIVLAAAAAIVAYYFGDIALTFAESNGFESDVAEVHEALGKTVAFAASAWAIIRAILWLRDIRLSRPLVYLLPVVSVVGAGLVTWTAYYGGQLVFDLGVNVTKAAVGT